MYRHNYKIHYFRGGNAVCGVKHILVDKGMGLHHYEKPNDTRDPNKVTCKKCIKKLNREDGSD
jgi:hypothetical protein